uniref:Uncharacterized protein n=1 Tax=Strigamia maritima TaxID=126957 RepID=T1IYH7_STRMM
MTKIMLALFVLSMALILVTAQDRPFMAERMGYGGGGYGDEKHGVLVIAKHTSYEKVPTKTQYIPMAYPLPIPVHHHSNHHGYGHYRR